MPTKIGIRVNRAQRLCACGAMLFLSFCVSVLLFGCGSNGIAGKQTASASGSGSGTSGGSGSGGDNGSGSGGNGGSGGSTGSSGSGSSGSGNSGSGSSGSGSSGSGSSGSGSSGSGSSGSGSSGSGSSGGSGSGGASGNSTPANNSVTLSNVQTHSWNWQGWGQIGPTWADCGAPCPESTWNQGFGVSNPSKSGNATQFQLNPKMPWADVLFTVSLIGNNSSNPDADHTLLPSIHHLTYDADVYVDDPSVTSGLEFDASLWMDGIAGMTFGTQCSFLGEGHWDVWDNSKGKWTDTGRPCKLHQGWHHVTLQFKRESDNSTTYEAIVLDGTTYPLNWSFPATKAPGGWWGLTANYQMDSDRAGHPITTYVDNMSITYQP